MVASKGEACAPSMPEAHCVERPAVAMLSLTANRKLVLVPVLFVTVLSTMLVSNRLAEARTPCGVPLETK